MAWGVGGQGPGGVTVVPGALPHPWVLPQEGPCVGLFLIAQEPTPPTSRSLGTLTPVATTFPARGHTVRPIGQSPGGAEPQVWAVSKGKASE